MSGQTPKLDAANARMLARRRPTPAEMNAEADKRRLAGFWEEGAADPAEGRENPEQNADSMRRIGHVKCLEQLAWLPKRESSPAFRSALQPSRELLALIAPGADRRALAGELHANTIAALAKEGVLRSEIADIPAERLSRAIGRALFAVEGRRPGQPQKGFAKGVAAVAIAVYEAQTGKHATRRYKSEGAAYGPAHDFVAAVFKRLGIDASPDMMIRAIKKKRAAQ